MNLYKPIPAFQHERFLARIYLVESGCWEYIGPKFHNGYGAFGIGRGNQFRAHRVSFAIFKSDNPNMQVDHICRNRICINPDHLRLVDQRTNNLENSISYSSECIKKTHCIRGHEFTIENTGISSIGQSGYKRRRCKLCERNRKIKKGLGLTK